MSPALRLILLSLLYFFLGQAMAREVSGHSIKHLVNWRERFNAAVQWSYAGGHQDGTGVLEIQLEGLLQDICSSPSATQLASVHVIHTFCFLLLHPYIVGRLYAMVWTNPLLCRNSQDLGGRGGKKLFCWLEKAASNWVQRKGGSSIPVSNSPPGWGDCSFLVSWTINATLTSTHGQA